MNGILASTLTTTVSQNTLNNPINATTGRSYFYSIAFTGGPLGGNVKTITNTGEFKYFHPVNHRRNAIGVRFLTAWTTGYGGEQVPPYSRFYMGGENDLRGFDIRAISPVTYIPSVFEQAVTFLDNRHLSGAWISDAGSVHRAAGRVHHHISRRGPAERREFRIPDSDRRARGHDAFLRIWEPMES